MQKMTKTGDPLQNPDFGGSPNIQKGVQKVSFFDTPKIRFLSKMGHLWTGLLGSTFWHVSKKGSKK